MIAMMVCEQRLDLAALATEDTEFGYRKYVSDEVALALRLSPWQGVRLIESAELTGAYPCLLACVEQGRWLLEHADAVLDELAGSGLEPADCARVVELVVAQQQAITPHQLRGAVRTAIVLQDLEEAYRRVARVKRDRDVRSWDGKDGGGCALVSGPKPLIAALMASLEALTWPRQPGDTRTASQRRFDALMDLMCGRALPGQWQAQLIATLATAEGDDSQLAEIPGLGTILPSEARALIAQAGLRRVVTDSSGNLITIDPTVVQPDLDPTQDAGPSQRLRTDEREPDPVHTAPGDANEQDLAWLGAQEPRPDTTADTVPPVLDLGEHDVPPTDAELRWLEDQTDRATDYAEQDRQSDRRRRDAAPRHAHPRRRSGNSRPGCAATCLVRPRASQGTTTNAHRPRRRHRSQYGRLSDPRPTEATPEAARCDLHLSRLWTTRRPVRRRPRQPVATRTDHRNQPRQRVQAPPPREACLLHRQPARRRHDPLDHSGRQELRPTTTAAAPRLVTRTRAASRAGGRSRRRTAPRSSR